MSSPLDARPDAMVPGCRVSSRHRHRRIPRQSLVLIAASIVALVSLLLSAILVLETDGSSHRVGTTRTIDVTAGTSR